MQNDHDYRFPAGERVRELHREARNSHLIGTCLQFILGSWLPKIRAALRRRSVDTATQAVRVPSCRSVHVGRDR